MSLFWVLRKCFEVTENLILNKNSNSAWFFAFGTDAEKLKIKLENKDAYAIYPVHKCEI